MPALIRTDESGKVHKPYYLKLPETRIGSARSNAVWVNENIVAAFAAVLRNEHGRWRLTCKTDNPLVFNGMFLWDTTIAHGAVFELGCTKFFFDQHATYETDTAPATFISGTAQMLDPAAGKAARPGRLTEQWGDRQAYTLGSGGITIGKEGYDLNIADDPFVSGLHCTIYQKKGRFIVKDNRSKNGTTVGVVTLRDGAEAELTGDAVITVGTHSLSFRYLEPGEVELGPAPKAFYGMIGESPAMKDVTELIEKVAGAEGHVLITGETGTGKELVAAALHALSPRGKAGAPFHPMNCAGLTSDLAESMLFGHLKGSFTGAQTARSGAFGEADGGTLFFDELGEMSPAVQASLLRAVQSGEIRSVGSDKPHKVNVRIVAATNRNLERMIREGTFHEDLHHRLNVFSIRLPPLKERGDDVLLIADALMRTIGEGKRLSDDARRRLRDCNWSGNIRVLESAIQRATTLTSGPVIEYDALDLRPMSMDEQLSESAIYLPGLTMEQREQRIIRATLDRFDGDREKVAAELQIGYSTINRKIRDWGWNVVANA